MSAIDQLGFVPIDEIQNIFSSEMAEIERELRKNGCPTNPRLIVEWIDAIRLTLMSRARDNLTRYVQNNPEIKKEARDERAAREQQEARQTWEQRVMKSRQKNMINNGE